MVFGWLPFFSSHVFLSYFDHILTSLFGLFIGTNVYDHILYSYLSYARVHMLTVVCVRACLYVFVCVCCWTKTKPAHINTTDLRHTTYNTHTYTRTRTHNTIWLDSFAWKVKCVCAVCICAYVFVCLFVCQLYLCVVWCDVLFPLQTQTHIVRRRRWQSSNCQIITDIAI